MATVTRRLPSQPHLDIPKREARELLKAWRAAQPEALERIRGRHPKFRKADDVVISAAAFRLSDAQLVIAREYTFSNWAELKERVNLNTPAGLLDAAIRADDCDTVVRLLHSYPKLLRIPVRSGNWGQPMGHAANLGRLRIIKAVAELGAKDFQHAFDRALLQGHIDCARWLYEHGAELKPGIVMGTCETLNPAGMRFLAELNAPFTDARGNRLAPLAMVLETYCRNPGRKHEMLEILVEQGYQLPETPIIAFHYGRADRLEKHLRTDPKLIERRFSLQEIYPPDLGCAADGRGGMHWTPVAGTTLLHLAIDFDEREIFDLLLAHGADVNARANVDAAGFGGHTPLFNAIVCSGRRDAYFASALLNRGASPSIRASVRKFLDWTETPGWHETREVTPAGWGHGFPDRGWVNVEALRVVDSAGGLGGT